MDQKEKIKFLKFIKDGINAVGQENSIDLIDRLINSYAVEQEDTNVSSPRWRYTELDDLLKKDREFYGDDFSDAMILEMYD